MTLWHGELIRAPWASLSLSVGKVSAFFATKSLDEYLYLQQLALMEIGRVIMLAHGSWSRGRWAR